MQELPNLPISKLETRSPCALMLSFSLEAQKMKDDLMSQHEVHLRVDRIDKRLRVSCAGLLELGSRRAFSAKDWRFYNQHIQYSHRTAKDFLSAPENWARIMAVTAHTDFKYVYVFLIVPQFDQAGQICRVGLLNYVPRVRLLLDNMPATLTVL